MGKNIIISVFLATVCFISCSFYFQGVNIFLYYKNSSQIDRITLNDVFNIIQVSPFAKIILQELSCDNLIPVESDLVPSVVGLIRQLPEPIVMKTAETKFPNKYIKKPDEKVLSDSLIILTSAIKSEGASAIRVKFKVKEPLPYLVKLFVYTADGEIYYYTSEMFDNNELWSHMFFSNEVFIQIQIPLINGEYDFSYLVIEEISHINEDSFLKASCLEDVNCAKAKSYSGFNGLKF